VYAWGAGSFGRLGVGSDADQFVPKIVEGLRSKEVLHVACGAFHSVAVIDPVARDVRLSLRTIS